MSNASNQSSGQPWSPNQAFTMAFYSFTFALGLLGNGLFIAVAVFFKKHPSNTEVCLLHLTVANILLMVTHCFFMTQWALGDDLGCRLVTFLNQAAFSACVLLLACVALHQCLSVSRSRAMSRAGAQAGGGPGLPRKLLYFLLWALAISCSVPDAFLYRTEGGSQCVVDDAQKLLGLFTFVAQFTLTFLGPALVISACYARLLRTVCGTGLVRKRQVCWVVVALLTTFYVFQLPRHVCICLDFFGNPKCLEITYIISTLSACTSPIIYLLFWHKFRERTKALLTRCRCLKGSGKINSDPGNISTST